MILILRFDRLASALRDVVDGVQPRATAMVMELTDGQCESMDCTEKLVTNPKKTIQLCKSHASDKDAMMAQAAKAQPLPGGKSLKTMLEELEQTDKMQFLQHLRDFGITCFDCINRIAITWS